MIISRHQTLMMMRDTKSHSRQHQGDYLMVFMPLWIHIVQLQTSARHSPTVKQCLDLARMHGIEDQHHTQHQHGVEDVQEPFVAEDEPVIALDELCDSKH